MLGISLPINRAINNLDLTTGFQIHGIWIATFICKVVPIWKLC
jgi:hypothetical protein